MLDFVFTAVVRTGIEISSDLRYKCATQEF